MMWPSMLPGCKAPRNKQRDRPVHPWILSSLLQNQTLNSLFQFRIASQNMAHSWLCGVIITLWNTDFFCFSRESLVSKFGTLLAVRCNYYTMKYRFVCFSRESPISKYGTILALRCNYYTMKYRFVCLIRESLVSKFGILLVLRCAYYTMKYRFVCLKIGKLCFAV